MQVRIGTIHSSEELQEIVNLLISNKVLNASEVFSPADFRELAVDFLNINDLLYPAFDRLVRYSNDSRKGWHDQNETGWFYQWLALQLLRGCPLQAYKPTCEDVTDGSGEQNMLVLKAGSYSESIPYDELNHPEFTYSLLLAVNKLLWQHGSDLAYFELELADNAIFLLLTSQQYQLIIDYRLLRFDHILYPEIEAWRSTMREEDLLF